MTLATLFLHPVSLDSRLCLWLIEIEVWRSY